MPLITFIYLHNKEFTVESKEGQIYQELIKFANLIEIQYNKLIFIYKGKIIRKNDNLKIKNTNVKIFIYNLENIKDKKEELNYLLCPQCNSLASININENKINIENCENNHKIPNLSIQTFNYFFKNQHKYICYECKNNKNYYNNFFYALEKD
jgi:hypothetical protein